jgi:Transcription factor PAP1
MKVVTPLGLPDTLDEQTFVRTLNALCLTHGMQLLILDSPHSLSVQRKFCRPLKVSSPAVIASRIAARLVAMVLDAKVRGWEPMPWVDSDITPWRLSDDLLELTPRDIWGFLKSHPNFRDVDLKSFYQSLVDKSFCSGSGPVLAQKDVENALISVLSSYD